MPEDVSGSQLTEPNLTPNTHARTSSLKHVARVVVILVVVVAWGWFLAGQIDTLQDHTWQFAPLSLLLGTFFAALYFAGLAIGWALLLVHVGQHQAVVPLHKGARIWLMSMVTRYVPGNIWHILSRVALANHLGVSKTRVLASATIEQMLTILGALAVVILTLPGWSLLLTNAQLGSTITITLLLLPMGLLGMHPRIFGALLTWISIRLKRPDIAWNYQYSTLLKILSVFVAANVCAGVSLAVVLAGLTPIQLADLPLILGSAALAWVIGYLSFLTPSGLGVREGVLTALLVQVYPLPVAIVASLLFRIVSTLGELVAVFISWVQGKWQKETQLVDKHEISS